MIEKVYSQTSLSELRDRVDLVELLGRHIKLQRSGRYFKACCPFHQEKTPSLTLERGQSHYHCFGCGAHGDGLAFVMSYLGMNFIDAVEYLAAEFHVRLEKSSPQDQEREKDFKLLDQAANFFHHCLLHTEEGQKVIENLYDRAIDLAMIRRFRLGFAPAPAFFDHFIEKEKLSTKALERVGLWKARGLPFFSERVMIPICDRMGRVIGFTARALAGQEKVAKYINSPETSLFKKSRVLFGLHIARRKIAREGRAILVEGQIDALRMIENGFEESVASQGTAFGKEHAEELIHIGMKEAILFFDGDAAGKKASFEVGKLLLELGVEVKVVSLPAGKDPDLLLLEGKKAAADALIEKAASWVLFSVLAMKEAKKSARQIATQLAAVIENFSDPLAIFEARKELARALNLPLEVLPASAKKSAPSPVKKEKPAAQAKKSGHWLEMDLARLLLVLLETDQEKAKAAILRSKSFDFTDLRVKKMVDFFDKNLQEGHPCDALALASAFGEDQEARFLDELLQKKVDSERVDGALARTFKLLSEHAFKASCLAIKKKIDDPLLSEEERMQALSSFDLLVKKGCEIL